MAGHRAIFTLFRGPSVEIADYRCRESGHRPAPEEAACRHEVVLPRAGVFVKHVGGERIVADANRVLFFNAGEPYAVSHPAPGGDDCTVLALSPALLREAAAAVDPAAADRADRPFAVGHAPSLPPADLLHRRLVHGLARGGLDGLAVEETAVRLVAALLARARGVHGLPLRERPAGAAAVRRQRELADAAQELLARRFRDRFHLADLAGRLGCSPFHLTRVFRRWVGVPLHRYRNRLRLREAVEAVAAGVEDLTGLALDLGFADHSHFTNAFRRELGRPPSALRRPVTAAELADLRKNLQA